VPDSEHTREVARRVVEHFRAHQRDLPWRRTRDPYRVWVSEIMLQQTRVATVVPFFERWLERFPTIEALATGSLDDVLAAWSGLGYYSRARNLHRGAREVVAAYAGTLPRTAEELARIPGIGPYTAGAIASQAFDQPAPLVDGNVARVLARLYAVELDVKSSAGKRALWELAGRLVPDEAPGDFNQGLMELGATVCTPAHPDCDACPLASLCRARAEGRETELPNVARRKAARDLPLIHAAAAWVQRGPRVLFVRRMPSGLFGGLWELPQAENRAKLAEILSSPIELTTSRPVAVHRQTLSHRRLHIEVWPGRIAGRLGKPLLSHYDRVSWQELAALARPDDETTTGEHAFGVAAATRAIIATHREQDGWKKETTHFDSSRRATRKSSKGSRR